MNFDYDDDDDSQLKPARIFFLDTNLDSPVLTTELEATKNFLVSYCKAVRSNAVMAKLPWDKRVEISFFRKVCKLNQWKAKDIDTWQQLIPEDYAKIEQGFLVERDKFPSYYEDAKRIAKMMENAVADGLEARGLPRESIMGTADQLGNKSALRFRDSYEQFCNLFGRAESRVKNSKDMWTKGVVGACEIWVHPQHALLKLEGVVYTSSLNQILMLKDKLSTRYMMLEHVLPLRLPSTLTKHMIRLFSWQDRILTAYGNKAYEVLKATEPMFKTRLSHITDNVFGDDTAYTRMIEKMYKKEKKIVSVIGTNAGAIEELCDIVESVESIDEIVEMFGCLKTCGHPIIDPVRGGLSAAAEARSPDKTSLNDAQTLRNTFCHIFLTSYITKNGKWPKLTYLKQGTKMEILNSRQERDVTYHSYPLEEWTFVEWNKLFDMDYFPNFLELMDDKSISYKRSEKHLSWELGSKPTSQRRLLLEVLRREKIDLEPLVKRISKRDVPKDWMIVSLYPKEREFKEDPRMFAMLVMEMRCFFTCVEANIADKVFRYMPQQTMTKTKTQIQERFLSFTDPGRDPNDWTLFLEVDLSRWNLRWRQMTIHQIGHDLNRMFGVKGTFTVVHWFFQNSQIVVRVGGLKPEGIELEDPPETGLAWRNHLGGFEGLNQKLWTAATYAMVEMAIKPLLMDGTISSYELIGQGDNQVLRVGIKRRGEPREEVIPRVRDEINERLEKTCADVNQEVKPEENVESTSVLTYSKDVYVKGVEYPTTLKKHSRLFPVTAMDFPSTAMNASAIMAGAVAAAENSRHPLCSAVVGWYHTARYLLSAGAGYCIHGRNAPKFTIDEVIAALTVPPSMGGYIGTPVASFMYKGGSDPLGKEISSLRLVAESDSLPGHIASRALRGLEERYCIDPNPNLEVLIDNPYGLPLSKVTSPLSKVGHLTLDAFKMKVQNGDIRPLLETSVGRAERILKEDILSVRPLNPLLAHDLFEASGFGTVKVMRKMFITTRTIQTVAQWANPNITHVFLRADINDVLWFKNWFSGLPKRGYSRQNSLQLSELFRTYWGVPLHGVSNFQPLDCVHHPNTTRNPSSIKWSSHSSSDLLTTRGPLSGYLGTATREKRSEHGYRIVDSGAPSRSMMKLQLIRSQAYGNNNFNELLDRIGKTRTNVKLSDITDILNKILGGSIAHKYATAIRNMAASYVGPLNFVTHIRLDTDSLGKVSGGADNYPFMTQEFMVFTMAGAKLLNVHNGCRSGELIVDTEQMTPLPDDSLVCPPVKFEEAWLPKSKLLFTPNLMLARTFESSAKTVPRGSVATVETYQTRETVEMAATGFFIELLRDKSKAKLLADTRGSAATPARLQMDIAEAHALGPKTICKAIASAIMLSTLRDTFRTLHLHPERWDESLFLVHNISTCVRACASYWRHPLFSCHPDSPEFSYSQLRYAGSMAIHRRLEAYVRRQLVNITNTLNNKFWTDPVPAFAGEHSMSIVEAFTTAGAKHLYQMYIIGDPRAREFGNIYSGFTRLPSNAALTPEDQLSLLRTRAAKMASVYLKAGDFLLARKIKLLGHLKGIIVFNDDCRTVLRFSRKFYVGEGLPRPRRIQLTGFPTQEGVDVCANCMPDPVSKHQAIWNRNAKRRHGGFTTSGYTWLPILGNLVVLKNVRIIGSGNGGLADLLLSVFNCEVIGHDLESDMPRDVATLLHYTPVGIQSQNSPFYTQSDLCLTTSGDWLDTDARQAILNEISSASTLFVDITQTFSPRHLIAVNHAMENLLVDRMYLRWMGEREILFTAISSLQTRFSVCVWACGSSYGSDEIIVEVSRQDPKHLHKCGKGLTIDSLITEDMHKAIPPRMHELAMAATCSVVHWEKETLYEMNHAVSELCRSLLNKPKHRQMYYYDRIALILAHLTMYAAVSPNPIEVIQGWVLDESFETDMYRYAYKESVVTHLLKYVPRIRMVTLT